MALSGAMCNDSLRERSKCGMRDNRGMYQGGPRRHLAFYKVEGELKKKKIKRTLNQRRKIFNQVSSQSLLYIWFLCFNANGSFWTCKLILI